MEMANLLQTMKSVIVSQCQLDIRLSSTVSSSLASSVDMVLPVLGKFRFLTSKLAEDTNSVTASQVLVNRVYSLRIRKKKERKSIYIAPFYIQCISQSAQAWITQFYLQIYHAYLSFISVHQMAPPLTQVEDIQLQYYWLQAENHTCKRLQIKYFIRRIKY